MAEKQPYLIESVDNALRLLLHFRQQPLVRVTDASELLGVAPSTAHRLLTTLAHHGFVAQDRVTKGYRAGRVFVELGLAAVGGLDIRRKARQEMEALSASLRETVNLMVSEGSGCRFIDGVEGDRPIRVSQRTGLLLPAHATSGGKVLLAELDQEELRGLFPKGLGRVTEHTITDFAELERELEAVRSCGYATNVSETELGLNAVAVAIRDHHGRAVAALAVSVPAPRMSPVHIPGYVEALKQTAAAISRNLA